MKIKILIKENLFYLFYLILSLFSIWLLSVHLLGWDYIIAGHDSGLALDSKAFLETRLYGWDERINFGQDNSLLFGSLTLHAFDFIFSYLAGVPYAGNQLNLFFWLSLIFISAFILALQLKEKLGRNFVFIFPVIILFNFYVFQSLFILERAKYSLIVASLLFLAIIVRLFDKKISILIGAILSSLIFSIFNGGSWLGLPLYGGLLVIIITLLCFLLIADIRSRNLTRILRFWLFLILSGGFFVLINSYSLLPYLQTFLAKDYLIIQNNVALESNKAWVDYISQGSSFLNIFRMQGVPDWYVTKFTASETHSYARLYLNNKLLVTISFLFPVIAFSSLVMVKNSAQKKIIGLTALIAMVSMIFMSGSRSPLGFIYEFLYQHVPGFIIFRSSFYKFGYAFIFAYSLMLAFTCSVFIDFLLQNIKPLRWRAVANTFLITLIISSWIVYHQSLLDRNIFNWRTEFSTRVKIPDYVNEYKKYVEKENLTEGRTLILPKLHEVWLSDGYDWGYWSLSTIHYSLSKQPIVANTSGLNEGEKKWVDLLYKAIEQKDAIETQSIIKRLGITRFLVKNDAITQSGWSGGLEPQIYKDSLESFDFIKKEKQFGQWDLYKVKLVKSPLFFPENNLTQLTQEDIDRPGPFIGDKRTYLKIENSKDDILNQFTSQRIDRFKCQSCILEAPILYAQLVWPRILPNSILFPLKLINEESKLEKITDPSQRMETYFGLIMKRAAEIDAMFYAKTHDAYIISNLKIIDEYLDQIIQITESTRDPNDFESAKRTLDGINSVEQMLKSRFFPEKNDSQIIKEAISKTLWKIYNLKKFYSIILDDSDQWATKKVFEVNVTDPASYQLYLNEDTLPMGPENTRSLPEVFVNQVEISLNLSSYKNKNWILLNSDKLKAGKNEIILKFKKSPNLLNIDKSMDVIETPQGRKQCYKGNVNPLANGDVYMLKVKTAGQALRFFTKEESSKQFTGFLDWNSALRIDARFDVDYFQFFYPKPKYTDETIYYICGDYSSLPSYKEFIMEEISVPEIIGVKSFKTPATDLPEINYERIDPTKFSVSVKSAKDPFILVMNQRYSPLWTIKDRNTNREINAIPFQIDLYATGWIINTKEDLDLLVEYKPQEYFKMGLWVTGFSLLSLTSFLIVKIINKKRL